MGKIQSGILLGTVNSLGSFTECTSIETSITIPDDNEKYSGATSNKTLEIDGKYCNVQILTNLFGVCSV